jgi:D-proline reductase (dithiol) PrdA
MMNSPFDLRKCLLPCHGDREDKREGGSPMSIRPEDAKAHAHAPAVTCCRFEAGTVVGPEQLEDPTVLPELEQSGFLHIPDDCLTIGEALGTVLRETVDGFTPLTPSRLRPPEAPHASHAPLSRVLPGEPGREYMARKVIRKHFGINAVKLGRTTNIQDQTLYIRADLCQDALHADALLVDVQLDIVGPERYGDYSHTIMDVQPIATKQEGGLGTGVTRVLDGVIAVVTGTDENGIQIGEFGSSEGIMQHQIMWGRPGAPDAGDILIKTQVTIKANTQMERPGPLAAHKATDVIVQEIRHALQQADDQLAIETEALVHTRRPGCPKVVIVKEMMGQGAMHDNLLMPVEPVGVFGAKANVDLGNVPIVVSPVQVLDGCIHALTCVGPASKETSRHYWREPLLIDAMRDTELDLCAVILVGSPQSNAEKQYVSRLLGMTVEAMDVAGAIVTTEGFGNNHIDFASHIEQIGQRNIPVVGMTYSAVQGQLVTGNPYMDALVELNKSATGMEDCVLATNTLIHEDAVRAIAMLKAKMIGEPIQPAETKWAPEVKLRNLQAIGVKRMD